MRTLAALLLYACSSVPIAPDAGDAAGVSDVTLETSPDAAIDAVDGTLAESGCNPGSSCNCLVDSASQIDIVYSNDQNCCNDGCTPPPPAGGAITSGEYHLTSVVYFNCCITGYNDDDGGYAFCGAVGTTSSTIIVDSIAQTIELASTVDHRTYTFATSATNITIEQTCPTAAQNMLGYTATATTIELYGLDNTGTFVEELTRQ